jgi:integrase
MAVRKLKGSWWVDFQVESVRYRKRSPLNSKVGAESFEVQMRQALAEKGAIDKLLSPPLADSSSHPPLFTDFVVHWMDAYVLVNNKPSEQRSKHRIVTGHLIPYFGKKRLDQIKTIDIEEFKAKELKRGVSAKTVNNRLATLRKCLVTAIDWEELKQLPKIQLLKVIPPKFRFLTELEVQRIITASQTRVEQAMVLVAARTGLRFSEVRALEWVDVNLETRQLTVRRSAVGKDIGTPKNGRIRHIPLTCDVVEALVSIKIAPGLVFPFQCGMFHYWTALRRLQEACSRCGIEPIGWHTLRHTFASQLVSRGASLKSVQDLLGHSTVNMTLRYAHLAPEVLRDTISLLEPKANSMSTWRQPEANMSPKMLEKLLSSISFSSPK